MLTNMAQGIIDGFGNLLNLVSALALSPFTRINDITATNEVLGFINWLIPLNEMIAVMELWLAAIALWYVASKAMRWMKAIS